MAVEKRGWASSPRVAICEMTLLNQSFLARESHSGKYLVSFHEVWVFPDTEGTRICSTGECGERALEGLPQSRKDGLRTIK